MSTHDLGGIIDVVASRIDDTMAVVSVDDVGLSDQRLLQWSVNAGNVAHSVKTTTLCRPCKRLSVDDLRQALQTSPSCHPDSWDDLSVDDVATLYDDGYYRRTDSCAECRCSFSVI